MGTELILDVDRTELVEPGFTVYRRSKDIANTRGGNNLVSRWETGSITLKPVQFTTAFTESDTYEDLKFRLDPGTLNYDPRFWREVPMNTVTNPPSDHFYTLGIPSNFVKTAPSDLTGVNLVDHFQQSVLAVINEVADHGWNAIQSTLAYPVNQGYCLRFFVDGRQLYSRGRILEFRFGNFALCLNSDGIAELWQRENNNTHGYVYSFQWATAGNIHKNWHQIVVYPHARDAIEFVCQLQWARRILMTPPNRKDNDLHRAVYRLPGGPYFEGSDTPIITDSGPWSLRLSREFRHTVQVSKLAFRSGFGTAKAWVIDAPLPIEFAPTVPLGIQPDGDLNLCYIETALIEPTTGGPFVADGQSNTPQLTLKLAGRGDLCDALASSATPEIYGYHIDKVALFRTETRTPITSDVQRVSIDQGDHPENERLTVHCDNGIGQLDLFKATRADIPLQLIDTDTGVCYFEGTSFRTRGTDAPSNHPVSMEIEAIGMADQLLRVRWWNPPNFGKDPSDPYGRAWFWQDSVRRCFQAAGFDPFGQVVFEDVYDDNSASYLPADSYNFRLWLDGDAGGTGEGADRIGGSHKSDSPGGRWWPTENSPVYLFLDYIVRQIMGWNFYWDRQTHVWRIYKRPTITALGIATPKAIWAKSTERKHFFQAMYPEIPVYTHRMMAWEITRPEYTTLICYANLVTTQLLSKEELSKKLADLQGGKDIDEPSILSTRRIVGVPFDNHNGYVSPSHPNPDQYGTDYLGRMRTRAVYLKECGSRESVLWIGRRFFEDLCFGRLWRNWNAEWGDVHTAYLRKWDVIMLDTGEDLERFILDRVEPEWGGGGADRNIRARFSASKWRSDAPAPR